MKFHRPIFYAFAVWLGALLLLLAGGRTAQAQAEPPARWLLIFDTSAAMKDCLPATRTAARQFLETAGNGQLRPDDSVGVWSYGGQLSSQFKAYNWEPASQAQIVSNLVQYVNQQRYAGASSLAALQLPLSRVIADSERLTVLVFCDGQSRIGFTPYDDGINQSFQDGLAERQKSRQPFVMVLRAQKGEFVGCTVNYPPAGLNLPDFPPLPAPPAPPSRPETNAVHPATVPSLVIVGNKVGTNANIPFTPEPAPKPAEAAPTNAPEPTKTAAVEPPPAKPLEPAPVIAISATNTPQATHVTNQVKAVNPAETAIRAVETNVALVVTQAVAAIKAQSSVTNAELAPAPAERETSWLVLIGVGLLLLAVIVVVFVARARRRPRASLISSSMQDQPPRK